MMAAALNIAFLIPLLAGLSTAVPSGGDIRSPVGECPHVDGANPKYLSDSKDCGKFYECSNGMAIPLYCPDGEHFDVVREVCDNPSEAKCDLDGSENLVKEAPSEQCPAVDGDESVYLANPDDDTTFYQCSNGQAILQHCSPNTVWKQQCLGCRFVGDDC